MHYIPPIIILGLTYYSLKSVMGNRGGGVCEGRGRRQRRLGGEGNHSYCYLGNLQYGEVTH